MTARLYCGEATAILKTLPADSIQCCVTSPPYWGLRDYGTGVWVGGKASCDHVSKRGSQGSRGVRASRKFALNQIYKQTCRKCGAGRVDQQLGLEPTPDEYVKKIVETFREVRRVLREDGVLWLNLGDCYATGAGKVGEAPGGGEQGARWRGDVDRIRDKKRGYRGSRLPGASGKHMSQVKAMGPLTQPNRMPIAGLKPKDLVMIPARVALAMQADGWYVRSDVIWNKPNPMPESVGDRPTKSHEYLFLLTKNEQYYYDAGAIAEPAGYAHEARWDPGTDGLGGEDRKTGRSTRRFSSGNLKRKAGADRGCPEGSGSNVCGNVPWEGITRNARSVWTIPTKPYPGAHFATFPDELARRCIVAGSRPGDTILDPFGGSGTVASVATGTGRNAVYIDLNPAYLELAQQRIGPMLCEVA